MSSNLTTYNSVEENRNRAPLFPFKSDRLVFIICILIAAVFWLLIKLSGEYTVENTLKIKFGNEPPGLRVTKMIDSTLSLSLTARGFSILRMNLFNKLKYLDVNVNKCTVEPKGNSEYAIYTQELTSSLAEKLGVSEKNILLSKAIITFDMEKTSKKKVPIVPVYSLQFNSQFDLYKNVTADPSSVVVYGPKSILDTLKSISTNKFVREHVMSNYLVNVGLLNPDPNTLRLSISEVALNFRVEKFTESEIMIPIDLTNVKYKIKTFPSEVKVYYRVAQIDFNKVHPRQFNISLVLNNIQVLQANELSLKLTKQPDFVRNVRIVPSDVEFLIMK